MPKFLAICLGSPQAMSAWEKLSESEQEKLEAKGIKAWGDWVEKNKPRITDIGAPLGSTLRIDKKGISPVTNAMTAYTVIEAPSHEAAAEVFKDHPHFTIFPGEAIEVMEFVPLPGQME